MCSNRLIKVIELDQYKWSSSNSDTEKMMCSFYKHQKPMSTNFRRGVVVVLVKIKIEASLIVLTFPQD